MSVLSGVKVLEFDAIGPAPFCGMMLADHGASILRLGRPGGQPNGIDLGERDQLLRGRPTVPFDLKHADDVKIVLDLVAHADILIEGYRPGVMERLGLGPDVCLGINPRLVYGRVTGYGQEGPLSQTPGHDINYIALTGALGALGDPDRPPSPPLSLVGDFGGGGMLLAFGVLASYIAALRTGQGDVVDAAMVDGSALLMVLNYSLLAGGLQVVERGSNMLNGGAPFYRCYETADGRYLAVGAIEPKFFAAFRAALDLGEPLFDDQMDRALWPAMRERIASVIKGRTLSDWGTAIAVKDACISPVLDMAEAPRTAHLRARRTFFETAGHDTPSPAPRFARQGSNDHGARTAQAGTGIGGWALPRALADELEKRLSESWVR